MELLCRILELLIQLNRLLVIYILEFTTELPKIFFILAQLIFEKSRISHVHKSSEEINHQVCELHEFPLLHFQESVYEQSVECGF